MGQTAPVGRWTEWVTMSDFQDLLRTDATPGGAFFQTDASGAPSDFNENVVFYPEWDKTRKQTVNVQVSEASLEGTREAHGDGVVFERPEDRSLRETIVIDVPVSYGLEIREKQPKHRPDGFKVGGTDYVVKRIEGRDKDVVSVICVRREAQEERTKTRVG